MTPPRNAIVIGGGIAGPATAMALQKAGIDAVVYEAHPAGADGVGAFLTVASNGIDALRVLGADEAALADAFPTPAMRLRSHTGKLLGSVRTGRKDGMVSRTLRRADLYRALHDEALSRGIAIEHGKRLVDAVETSDGVRAAFADGSSEEADVLIGCDGVHSTVRGSIDRAAPVPRYAGLLSTGGYARGVDAGAEPGTYEMVFGRQAFFGYVVAPGGEVWWFANLPGRGEPARGVETDLRGELLELFAGDRGPALELIRATGEIMPATAVHSIPRLPVWHTDRMVVTGDAAHAPSPTSGQGASLAIEDALVLARSLRDEGDVPAALARFEALRRPRVERIIKAADRMNSNKAPGPIVRVLRDATLPAILRLTADSKALREMYDYTVEWDERISVAA